MAKVETPIEPCTLGVISHENFFLFSRATFIQSGEPNGAPNYVSEGGSCYWHGNDESGDFVIRKSDHWCQYFTKGIKIGKRFRARIRSCSWDIKVSTSEIEEEVSRFGKCYLQDFERIMWKTKRRYKVIGKSSIPLI